MAGRALPSAKRYAQAVFDIAQASDSVQEWDEQLSILAQASGVPEFASLMQAPEIKPEERSKALESVLPSLSDGMRNLLMLIAKRGAVKVLPQVYSRFQELSDAAQSVVRVQVTSAIELTDADQKRITEQLAASLGKSVRITAVVKPELLGGLVIRVGDRVIDGSAQQRLQALRGTLARGIV